MPRKARIDAPGALHHIICRGIERKKIFRDDKDRDRFIERLGDILLDTSTSCYAWTLLGNHFHILLKTGTVPIATVMRRLLTGYAVYFNRRYRRHGHLFQNRYKSILCQEEAYLLELVRYIHLNPLRAKIATNLKELAKYPYCGHGRLVGRCESEWQETEFVLRHFGKRMSVARKKYEEFVEDGLSQGRQPLLTGGGLVRSVGGWKELVALCRADIKMHSDERILGDSDFMESVLKNAEETFERKQVYKSKGYGFEEAQRRATAIFHLESHEILGAVKIPRRVQARSLLCYWTVRELGLTAAIVASRLGITPSAVSRLAQRGEKLALENGYLFETD